MTQETRPQHPATDQLERELAEGRTAIQLVARGVAVRMTLQGFRFTERIAPLLLPEAQRLAVSVRIARSPLGSPILVVGPRTAR